MTEQPLRRGHIEGGGADISPVARAPLWLRQYYFSCIAALLLALTIWGFSDNLIWRIGQPSNRDPKFIAHGLFCLSWMIVFLVQASLVRSHNVRLHRRLGVLGFVVAIGVIASTSYVFVSVKKPWHEMDLLVQANRLLLVGYAVFVFMAYFYRSRPDWHRRCVLIASLYMLEPVLSRAFSPIEPWLAGFSEHQIDSAWWVFFVLLWNALFLSLFGYDRAVLGRTHPATWRGFTAFYAIWFVVFFF